MSFDLDKCERNSDGHWLCQTRGGHKVRVVCRDMRLPKYPLVALVTSGSGEWVSSYSSDGRISYTAENPSDLVNLPRKVKRWVNVYPDGTSGYASVTWNTKEEADANASDERIACVPIEWEEK